MIGRRAVVGLSLLCALMFCAFAAQSASAKGTTAFTCVKGAGATEPFKDPHCDEAVSTKEGYKHEEIAPLTSTTIDLTNAKTSHETKVTTPAVLRSKVAGTIFEIQCTEFTGFATIENVVDANKVMQVKGKEDEFEKEKFAPLGEFTKCTVIRPENSAEERHPCKVKEPINIEKGTTSETKETLGAGGKEMGVEFKPPAGKTFAKFTFEGTNCSLKGTTVEVTTTTGAIATSNTGSNEATTNGGATLKFTTAMTSETLKIGVEPAEFQAVFTPTMYNKVTKETENPISLTTTAT